MLRTLHGTARGKAEEGKDGNYVTPSASAESEGSNKCTQSQGPRFSDVNTHTSEDVDFQERLLISNGTRCCLPLMRHIGNGLSEKHGLHPSPRKVIFPIDRPTTETQTIPNAGSWSSVPTDRSKTHSCTYILGTVMKESTERL